MTGQLKVITVLFILFSLPKLNYAQVESLFNDIRLDESLETAIIKLKLISDQNEIFTVQPAVFPIARDREDHLVCYNVKTEHGIIDKAVFLFADNKLCYIEAKGNAYAVLNAKRQDSSRKYMDYDVYFEDKLFLKSTSDQAWILNNEAMHLNLFTWENPYLTEEDRSNETYNNSGKIPAFLKMGAELDALKPQLESNSKITHTEELDGSDPNAQLQVNCFGVNYLGFPRKFELRFGENKLNVVWILTAKGEEDRIRQELIKYYGQPIYSNDDWEIYDNWQIGLRLDKPEVLVMTKAIGQYYKKEYFKQ